MFQFGENDGENTGFTATVYNLCFTRSVAHPGFIQIV